MALSDDYGFETRRTGPKRFTEYSFGAIMVFVAQVGTALAAVGQAMVLTLFSYVFTVILPGAVWFPAIILIPTLAVPIASLYEIMLVYRLHSFGLSENIRIVLFNAVIIVAEILLLISTGIMLGLFVILMVQTSAVILFLNFLSIYLMRREDIQMEFRQNGNSV